uniref:Uncharacterized protein n=1 Tax=Nelumbo nucifera TaxID=4432 RepID=A0A822Z096_NELNU|nr:TPA_asm: hypothetical protein HUJ06_005528 [Nelumbo nucifera]
MMRMMVVIMTIVVALGIVSRQGSCTIVQFIFGDSLSDVGNNNYLSKSLARASLPWYGIDFGNGMPNGRFCNGRTVADIIGARQLMVFGLGPMGCIPLQRVLSSSGNCQEKTNNLAISFNKAAAKLLQELSSNLPNASFRFGDAYNVVDDVIKNPDKYGFENSDSPCCSFGRIRPALTCVPASRLCKDRSKYVFWDEYHPTDKANEIIANEIIRKLGFVHVNTTSSQGPALAPSS